MRPVAREVAMSFVMRLQWQPLMLASGPAGRATA